MQGNLDAKKTISTKSGFTEFNTRKADSIFVEETATKISKITLIFFNIAGQLTN